MSSKEHSCYSDELQDKRISGGSRHREVAGVSQFRGKCIFLVVGSYAQYLIMSLRLWWKETRLEQKDCDVLLSNSGGVA